MIQGAWMAACYREAAAFRRAAGDHCAAVQAATLRRILQRAESASYGRKYGFSSIRSVEEYRRRLPVNDYDDLKPWIDRAAAGEPSVLTDEPVRLFEETSGTSSGVRLIPYTAGLQQSFNRALHPWLFDLHASYRNLWGGPAYWVVSPRQSEPRQTSGGVPIGFAADSDYFGAWARPLIKLLTVVPEEAAKLSDPAAWRYVTLLALLRQPEMRLISLWNPTLFTSLIDSLPEMVSLLVEDLRAGTCRPPLPSGSPGPELPVWRARPSETCAFRLERAGQFLRAGDRSEFARTLWPKLALISSWSEAEAAEGAGYLRSFFPDVIFQTKGILATEGPVTVPRVGAAAPVLATRSAFFEFETGEEGRGEILLAHELQFGQRYRVIMTTAGGLYRYRLHDIVEMRGWWHNLPCLAFIGKEAFVSDLCGEKLASEHVRAIFTRLFGAKTRAWLAPEKPELPLLPGYYAFLPADEAECHLPQLQNALENALCENIHYRWAREARQLAPVKIVPLKIGAAESTSLRLQRLVELGRTISTAKLSLLDKTPGWHAWLKKALIG